MKKFVLIDDSETENEFEIYEDEDDLIENLHRFGDNFIIDNLSQKVIDLEVSKDFEFTIYGRKHRIVRVS